jgi:hypothetical protein
MFRKETKFSNINPERMKGFCTINTVICLLKTRTAEPQQTLLGNDSANMLPQLPYHVTTITHSNNTRTVGGSVLCWIHAEDI